MQQSNGYCIETHETEFEMAQERRFPVQYLLMKHPQGKEMESSFGLTNDKIELMDLQDA